MFLQKLKKPDALGWSHQADRAHMMKYPGSADACSYDYDNHDPVLSMRWFGRRCGVLAGV